MGEPEQHIIAIAVCTFRRASLDDTLRSLAALRLPKGWASRVIVADNDDHAVRRPAIEALGASLGLAMTYVHAPARNISVARNACLEACSADWLAFIDDDEEASPDWLCRLLEPQDRADIVFGSSRAIYPAGAPDWARSGDFHSNRLGGNDAAWNGYTSNVLISMSFVRTGRLRFAPELGVTGGEDTLFFFGAHQAGARFAYAPEAVVTEGVEPRRLAMGWLLRRRFRAGQVHWLVLGRSGHRLGGAIGAAGKFAVCLAIALAGAGRAERWRAGLLRAALHAGVLAAALGFPVYREYASSASPAAG